MIRLEGIFPALTTPFVDGRIAPEQLRANIERYEATGVGGYLVLGSTGEAPLLDDAERRELIAAARAAVPRAKPLVAGVTAESTAAAVRQTGEARDGGATAVLVGTPHYYRDQMTAAALITHFTEIADRSPLPVLLYNVPKFTALPLPLEVVCELSRHGNVAGMKDSSGSLDDLREVLARASAGFQLLCGASSLVREALSAGAAGAILAAAAAFPEPFAEVARCVGCGAVAEADRMLGMLGPCIRAATIHGVAGIKAAMDLRGLHGGSPRPPLLPAGPEARAGISRAIEPLLAAGILRPLA